MKNIKNTLRYLLYLLLVCITCVGCNNNDSYETREATVSNINTSEYSEGSIIKITTGNNTTVEKIDIHISATIKKTKWQMFISKIRAWANAL